MSAKKLHVITPAYVLGIVDDDAKAAHTLLNDALRQTLNEHGQDAAPLLKFVASIAVAIDSLVFIQMNQFRAQYGTDDERVLAKVPCGAPDRCTAPHVYESDLETREDGYQYATIQRENPKAFRPDLPDWLADMINPEAD